MKMSPLARLYIIGAGGFGREVRAWIQVAPEIVPLAQWEFGGFLDANSNALASYEVPEQIVGDPASFYPSPTDWMACAIGDPETKLRICRSIRSRGGRFVTLVFPNAVIGPNCVLGEGTILCPGSVLTTNITLGDFVTVNVSASIGHDAVVGPGCTLSGHVDITGRVVLGEGVFLGSHACVTPGITVGDYAVVGAGSVAVRNVPARTTVFGVPAKKIPVAGKEQTG